MTKKTISTLLARNMLAPSLLAIAATASIIAPASAQSGSVNDFQLPPASTPSATPQVQGPVDDEGPVVVRPRLIPSETPSPTPTAASSAAPSAPQATRPASRPSSQPSSQPVRTIREPARQQQILPEPSGDVPTTDTIVQSPSLPTQASPPVVAPALQPSVVPQGEGSGGLWWWLAALAGLIIAAAGAFLFWRKWEVVAATVPQIELPLVTAADDDQQDSPAGAVTLPSPKVEPVGFVNSKKQLQAKLITQSLSRSMMNVTLSFDLELQNLGSDRIDEISVHADLVSAHGQTPVADQIVDAATELQFLSFIPFISSRNAEAVKCEIRLPVGHIKTIAQGRVPLYVPLLRMRVESEGVEPLIHTFVVGIRPPTGGNKLLPFRLDDMAQTYRNIGLRQLD